MTDEMPTPETDARIQSRGSPFACVPIDFARRLERERDEARAERDAVVTNAMRLLTDGCEVHPPPEIDELKGCIVCVKAERDALRAAFDAACAFIDSHVADPDITAEMAAKYATFLNHRALIEEAT